MDKAMWFLCGYGAFAILYFSVVLILTKIRFKGTNKKIFNNINDARFALIFMIIFIIYIAVFSMCLFANKI